MVAADTFLAGVPKDMFQAPVLLYQTAPGACGFHPKT